MEKQIEITTEITQALKGVPSLESYQLPSGVASGQSPEKTGRRLGGSHKRLMRNLGGNLGKRSAKRGNGSSSDTDVVEGAGHSQVKMCSRPFSELSLVLNLQLEYFIFSFLKICLFLTKEYMIIEENLEKTDKSTKKIEITHNFATQG